MENAQTDNSAACGQSRSTVGFGGLLPVPAGAVWARHACGQDEWWTHGQWLVSRTATGLQWTLRHADKVVGTFDYLQDAMRTAETPNV